MTNGEVRHRPDQRVARTMLYKYPRSLEGGTSGCWTSWASPPPCCRRSNLLRGLATHPWRRPRIPIAGIAGDQQSALFGQLCFEKGMAKNTYGTGCFLLMNTGTEPVRSSNGLLTTVAIGPKGSELRAGRCGIHGGATIQWLRDELKIIHDARDTDYFASKVGDTNGVYLVWPFVGLGAPYWDPYARGAAGRPDPWRQPQPHHPLPRWNPSPTRPRRAGCHAAGLGIKLAALRKVDGGAVTNDFLMQFQADMMHPCGASDPHQKPPPWAPPSWRGPAVGFWKSSHELEDKFSVDREFIPRWTKEDRAKRTTAGRRRWAFTPGWAEEDDRVTSSILEMKETNEADSNVGLFLLALAGAPVPFPFVRLGMQSHSPW